MAKGVDGTLKFDTKIDESGFNKGLDGVSSSMAKAGKSMTGFKGVASKAMSAAAAGAKGLLAVLGTVIAAIGAVVMAVAGIAVAIGGAFATMYKASYEAVNRMVEGLSQTSALRAEAVNLKNAFDTIKGSLAGLFDPLVVAAMPILSTITSWLIRVINLVKMAIAALTGQSTYMQYVATSSDAAAKSTGGAAKNTKQLADNTKKAGEAAKGALAAFDEINVLQQDTAETGVDSAGIGTVGGVGGGIGAGGYLVETPIDPEALGKIDQFKNKLLEMWENIKATFSVVGEWFTTNVIDPISGKFEWLRNIFAETGLALSTEFGTAGGKVDTTMKLLWTGLKLQWTLIWGMMIGGFESLSSTIGGILGNIVMFVTTFITGLIMTFGGLIEFFTGVFTGDWEMAWQGIKDYYEGIWVMMTASTVMIINSIIDIVNGMIQGVISGINAVIRALKKLTITVPDWVPKYGGQSFSFSHLSELSVPVVPKVKIPELATGAVIPPNAAFLAMLGDQRHGTNIEAPEDLIRQIVREESGGGEDGMMVPITLMIDGEVLLRSQQKLQRRRGTSLVTGGAF